MTRAEPGSPRAFAVRVALYYAAVFIVYGTQMPFLPLWLGERGLDASAIALVTSVPLLVRLAVTPAVAVRADRQDAHAAWSIGLVSLAVVAALAFPAARGQLVIALLMLVFLVPLQSTMPLAETIAMRGVRRFGLDYGRMRVWGSLTFIGANLVGGHVVDRYGADAVPWMVIAGTLATLGACLLMPRERGAVADVKRGGGAAFDLAPVLEVLQDRRVVLLLLATGTIQASHAVFYTFGSLHWRAQEISSTWIGALWAIGVLAEVMLFWVSGAAVAFAGARGLLVAGGAAALVRWALMALDPPLWALVPLQVLHGATFGAAHLAAMHLIAELVDERRVGTAQSLYATVTAGLGVGVATTLAGPLFGAYGGLAYLAMALLGAVGFVIALQLAAAPAQARMRSH